MGTRLLHFHRKRLGTQTLERKTRRVVLSLALLTVLPSLFMTVGIVRKSIFENNVNRFVKKELSQTGTQIISNEVNKDSLLLSVVAVGREIPAARIAEAKRRMEDYGLKAYGLNIIQGEQSDSALMLLNKLTASRSGMSEERKQLAAETARANDLHQRLDAYTRYENLSGEMGQELSALFPQIESLSLANVVEARTDTIASKRYVVAMLGMKKKAKALPADQQARLTGFLKARIKADSLVVVWR